MTAIEYTTRCGNPYLADVLAPVSSEVTATDLAVTGAIPEHLVGRYLRNGANPASPVDTQAHHWFGGDAMVTGLELRDGRACWYRNRWVRTPAVCRSLSESTPPPRRLQAGSVSVGPNTNVLTHAGRTLALVEGGMASYELTDELETLGTWDADGTLSGGYTAHPLRDPETGELHAVSYSATRGHTVQYSVIDTSGRVSRIVDIDVGGSPMMHAFSLTEDYVVFYDLPVTWVPAEVAALVMPHGLRRPLQLLLESPIGRVRVPSPIAAQMNRRTGRFDGLPFAWNDAYPARIGVMPRGGTNVDVRWFDVEPCYVFHPVNAYSEVRDGAELLVLDVVRNERIFDRERRGPADGHPTLERWTITLGNGVVQVERLDDRTQEFPRVNDLYIGRKHRYSYTIGVEGGHVWDDVDGPLRTALYKHDADSASVSAARLDPDLVFGEMTFVANPDAKAEDDGVLMGYGYHRRRDEGQLLILDAQTLDTRAVVHLPQRVPMGFHGNWCPAG